MLANNRSERSGNQGNTLIKVNTNALGYRGSEEIPKMEQPAVPKWNAARAFLHSQPIYWRYLSCNNLFIEEKQNPR
jgi:hypothetical protein